MEKIQDWEKRDQDMVIVTGASGFVGRYCVKALKQKGHDVLATGKSEKGEKAYANSKIPFVRVDLANPEDLKKLPQEDVDAVIHCAGLLSIDRRPPLEYFMANAIATYKMPITALELFVNWKFSRMLTASKAVTIPFHKDYSSSR